MASPFQLTLAFVFVLVSLVHAFDPRFVNRSHHSPSLVKWSSIVDPIDTGLPDLSQVFVYPLSRGILSLKSAQRFTTLSFKLKGRTSKAVCSVTFEDPFTKGFQFPKENGSCSEASTAILGHRSNQLDPPYFLLLVVDSIDSGFAIWDIFGDGSVHVPISQLQPQEFSYPEYTRTLETFLLPPPNGNLSSVYFSLLLDVDLPEGNAPCFSVQSSLSHFKLETYYAIEGWASSNRSAQVQRSDGVLCLRNELFAQGLGPVQVTFSVTNMTNPSYRRDAPILFTVVSSWINSVSSFGRLNILEPDTFSGISFGLTDYPWLYYNSAAFQYNMTSNSSKPMAICDMMANCYQMDETVNGTKAKDGSKQYTVPEKVHSQLMYSPVVRIVTEDQKAKIQYFNGQKETLTRVKEHFPSARFGINLPQQPGYFHFLASSIINTTAGHAPDILSLPIHLLDQRTQQLTVSLDCPHADLLIESVNLQFASGIFNQSSINLSLPVGESFYLSTADFFRLPDHALPSAGRQLTGFQIVYRTLAQKSDSEGKKVQVRVEIRVEPPLSPSKSSESIIYRPKVKFERYGGGQDGKSRSDSRLCFNLTRENSAALLQSNWIPANPIPQTDSWLNNQGHIRVSYRSVDGKVNLPAKSLRVKQIIVGLANEYVHEKALVQKSYADNIYETIRVHSSLRNGRYALFYRISLEDGALEAISTGKVHVDFEWNFEEIDSALPSSQLCKGPTYGDVYCRLEPYTCPEHYFKYNQDTGSCKMIDRS